MWQHCPPTLTLTHPYRVLQPREHGGLQLVLVILIALLMPRSSILGGSKGSTASITEQAEGQSTNIAASSGEEYFSVIFDAGSTGVLPWHSHCLTLSSMAGDGSGGSTMQASACMDRRWQQPRFSVCHDKTGPADAVLLVDHALTSARLLCL